MSDFPEGITVPEGAQELVDACKASWAVIRDEAPTASDSDHGGAVDRFEAAMAELAEMDVHVNNEGEYPVFSLGVKETAYDSSVPVSGAKFLELPEEVALSTSTTAVDLSSYSPLKRCNLLVLHQAKGASAETPSSLYKLCGRMGTHHAGGQNFCGVHKLSMKTHPDGGKIYKITLDVVACCPKLEMALAWPLPVAHILEHCQEVGATPGMPMSTPFILSSHSKDRELRSVKTIGIPEYIDEDDAGSATGSASTQSDHGSGDSSRAPSPKWDGTGGGGEGAGDKASAARHLN